MLSFDGCTTCSAQCQLVRTFAHLQRVLGPILGSLVAAGVCCGLPQQQQHKHEDKQPSEEVQQQQQQPQPPPPGNPSSSAVTEPVVLTSLLAEVFPSPVGNGVAAGVRWRDGEGAGANASSAVLEPIVLASLPTEVTSTFSPELPPVLPQGDVSDHAGHLQLS
jgi:hypothetical protein